MKKCARNTGAETWGRWFGANARQPEPASAIRAGLQRLAVAAAYGWPDFSAAVPKDEILKRLLVLSLARPVKPRLRGRKRQRETTP